MLAGIFDGRASYDRKRGTQANTQFVVDCPLANERELSELVVHLARQIGIGVNANFARERLQGGNPRKTQLRLSASEAIELPFSNYIHMWALPASEAFDAYLRGERIDDGLMRAIWENGE